MFVLRKVHNQFKARGGRAIKIAAALCVAGLVAGVAGDVALAQVGGGNPTVGAEAGSVCSKDVGVIPCWSDPRTIDCNSDTMCPVDNAPAGCDDSTSQYSCSTVDFPSSCPQLQTHYCYDQEVYTGRCFEGSCETTILNNTQCGSASFQTCGS